MRRKRPKGERNNDPIVELTTVSTKFSAETLVAALDADGIKAFVGSDDGGGYELGLGFARGYRVMVLESDLAAARAITADVEQPSVEE